MQVNNHAFRLGFIAAMRQVASRSDLPNPDNWATEDVVEYVNGYNAGQDHFNGTVNKGTRRAETLGLVAAYVGFYGQASFVHPSF